MWWSQISAHCSVGAQCTYATCPSPLSVVTLEMRKSPNLRVSSNAAVDSVVSKRRIWPSWRHWRHWVGKSMIFVMPSQRFPHGVKLSLPLQDQSRTVAASHHGGCFISSSLLWAQPLFGNIIVIGPRRFWGACLEPEPGLGGCVQSPARDSQQAGRLKSVMLSRPQEGCCPSFSLEGWSF